MLVFNLPLMSMGNTEPSHSKKTPCLRDYVFLTQDLF